MSRRLLTSHDERDCPACGALADIMRILMDDTDCLHSNFAVVDADGYGHMVASQVTDTTSEQVSQGLQGGIEAAYLRAHTEEP